MICIILVSYNKHVFGSSLKVAGTLNHYKMVQLNFQLCALRGGGDKKLISSSLALELELALVLELVLELALVLGRASQMTDWCGGSGQVKWLIGEVMQ